MPYSNLEIGPHRSCYSLKFVTWGIYFLIEKYIIFIILWELVMISIIVTLFFDYAGQLFKYSFFSNSIFSLLTGCSSGPERPLVQSRQESWISTRSSLPPHFDCHRVSQNHKILLQLSQKSPTRSPVGPSQICVLQLFSISPYSISKRSGSGVAWAHSAWSAELP